MTLQQFGQWLEARQLSWFGTISTKGFTIALMRNATPVVRGVGITLDSAADDAMRKYTEEEPALVIQP